MKFLAVHPSCLMYSKIYLRLEPLGLELVAAAAERAGHSVQLIDLQCESHQDFFGSIQRWRPDVIAFCGNYLANVPEIIDLARGDARLVAGRLYLRWRPQRLIYSQRNFAPRRRCRGLRADRRRRNGHHRAVGRDRAKPTRPETGSWLRDTQSPPVRRRRSSSRSMICCLLAIWRDIAGNISSASSTRPLPLSSAEVARGTASFAAHGRSTDAITG